MNNNTNEPILKITNLKKSFGNNIIFDNINLNIKKNEVVVLLGPSGCGKSTLLRCIKGLEPIDSGEIYIDGVSEISNSTKVGMVFQSYDLFPHLKVIDNITLAPIKVLKRNKKEVYDEAKELLNRVGLSDKINSYPRQLSGGQKQRVAIVRALILKPELLLFDEVTAALDPEMVREVLDVILELAREGKTMMIVTHEMQFAKAVADRVIFIDQSKIVEDTDTNTFFDNPNSVRVRNFLANFSFKK